MQIGILGTGSVGSALADGFTTAGHEVHLGSRNPETASLERENTTERVEIDTQSNAVEGADVVILAVPAQAAIDIAAELADTLAGKPVVDATNEYPAATDDRPVAKRVAEATPDSNVVKAFNTIGAEHMADPIVNGIPTTMFVAGNDSSALSTTERLAEDLGFEPIEAGDLEAAKHMENLARFWIDLSSTLGRDIGFRLLQE